MRSQVISQSLQFCLLLLLISCSQTKQIANNGRYIQTVQATDHELHLLTSPEMPSVFSAASHDTISYFGNRMLIAVADEKPVQNKFIIENDDDAKFEPQILDEEPDAPKSKKKIEPWGIISVAALAVSFALGFFPFAISFGSGTIALSVFPFLLSIVAAIISLVRLGKHKGEFRGKALPWITLGYSIALAIFVTIVAIIIASS